MRSLFTQLAKPFARRRPSRAVLALEAATARLAEMDRTLKRVLRDVEQLKHFSGMVLGRDRAVALLATGERILVDPRDRGCGMNLLSQGRYEELEVSVLRRFARPGATFLDIGANYGYYTICAVPYLRPGGRIIAFEPNPHIHALLTESIYINGFGDVADARCVGAYDENAVLHFEVDETGPGGARVLSGGESGSGGNVVLEVPVVRLDDHLPRDLIVDIVKIDVEGREEQVLRGMRDVIARAPSIVIIMEIYRGFFGSDLAFASFLAFLEEDLGLTVSIIETGGTFVPASPERLREGMANVLLTKGAPPQLPALTILPAALQLGRDSTMHDDQIGWSQPAEAPTATTPIAHGPYAFLPAGTYDLVIDGAFEGTFVCQVIENFGELIWKTRFSGGQTHAFRVYLPVDMPRFEIAFWPADTGIASFRLASIKMWNA